MLSDLFQLVTQESSLVTFVYRLMPDLYHLLWISHHQISVYNPQTDGLVKQFSQTVKWMLHKVVDDDGHSAELLILYVLFTIWERPMFFLKTSPTLSPDRPLGVLEDSPVARQESDGETN